MTKKMYKTLPVYLPQEEYEFVRTEAFNQRISMSEYVRRLIHKQKEQHNQSSGNK